MRKILIAVALMLFTAISFTGMAYAQDTETSIILVNKDRFAIDLQDNKLILIGEPLSKEYESIYIEIKDESYSVVRNVEYKREQGAGVTINLNGLADGTYRLRVIYMPAGIESIINALIIYDLADSDVILENEELYTMESYDSNGDNFFNMKELSAWATIINENLSINDYYFGDGVADYLNTSYEEAYEFIFEEIDSGALVLSDDLGYAKFFDVIIPSFNIVIDGGRAAFNKYDSYKNNLIIEAKERADEYAADFYKNKDDIITSDYEDIVKQANSIVAGITNDYDKAKAISSWVSNNIEYDIYTFFAGFNVEGSYILPQDAAYVLKNRIGVCEGFSNLTVALLQAAGIPAKKITGEASGFGGWGPHAWTEAYVDNRWVFIDSTFEATSGCDYFDRSVAHYSNDHKRDDIDAYDADNDINDSLYFYDFMNDIMLKEIKNFPFNEVVNSTYGFDIKDLYLDKKSKEPFKLGEMKIDSQNGVIYVDYCRGKKPYTVIFSIVDNDGYGLDYNDENYSKYGNSKAAESMWYFFTPANAKLRKPADPVRKGYTFLGWYNKDTDKKWNFATDKVTSKYNYMYLVTRWKKVKSDKVYYKVIFQHNNGVSPKSVSLAVGSKLTKPEDPSPRTNYKFVGWYKDSKCTKKWDFSKDKVTANTTLYSKWKKK